MEDVLDLYAETPEPDRPVIYFEESPTQLIGEVRPAIPAKPGQLSAMTASIGATAQPAYSSFLTPHKRRTHQLDVLHREGPGQMDHAYPVPTLKEL